MDLVHQARRRMGQLEDAKAALHEAKAARLARLAAVLDGSLRAADAALLPHRCGSPLTPHQHPRKPCICAALHSVSGFSQSAGRQPPLSPGSGHCTLRI